MREQQKRRTDQGKFYFRGPGKLDFCIKHSLYKHYMSVVLIRKIFILLLASNFR